MPPFGHDLSDSDSDEDRRVKRDEYGDIFEDYGFLKRAEEYKEKGNSEFRKERYERALKEYDMSLEQLLTVAYDKSIVLGKRKWNDVVVMRSTLHLNKSTCHFKLERWRQAAEEATECLVGNVRDEQMFTDPHIRNKVKQAEQKHGRSDVLLVEQRLPRPTRAKAWFRLSRCYTHLEYLDRAKEAMAKALEMCDDDQLLSEMSQHSLRIDVLEKQQKDRQKKQFRGFWDKLQERGGYVEQRAERERQRKAEWDSLNYVEKFSKVQELDDSEDEDDMPPLQGNRCEELQAAQAGLEEAMRRALPGAQVESAVADLKHSQQRSLDESSRPDWAQKGGQAPGQLATEQSFAGAGVRPSRSEEAQLPWVLGEGAGCRTAPVAPGAAEAWALREEESARMERQWRREYERRRRDDMEEEELRKARERVAQRSRLKAGERAKARMDALDNSDDD